MKKIVFLIVSFFVLSNFCFSQSKINIVVIGAHPDDCDIDAGGTALLFSKMGHNVKFVSLTNGDAGHYAMGGGELAKIRIAEAKEAAERELERLSQVSSFAPEVGIIRAYLDWIIARSW